LVQVLDYQTSKNDSIKTEKEIEKKKEQKHLIERWNLEEEASDKIDIEKQRQFKQKIIEYQKQNVIEQRIKKTQAEKEKEKDKVMIEQIIQRENYLDQLELDRKVH